MSSSRPSESRNLPDPARPADSPEDRRRRKTKRRRRASSRRGASSGKKGSSAIAGKLLGRWRRLIREIRGVPVVGRGRHSRPPVPGARLNRRGLTLSLVAVLAVGLAVYGNWQWQRRQTARGLREQAEELAQAGQWRRAAERLEIYSALFPSDSAARLALAEAADQSAANRHELVRAAELYQAALRESAEPRIDDRCRLAEICFLLGRDDAADVQLQRVLAAEPRHPLAWRLQALAEYRSVVAGRREPASEVGQTVETAHKLNPQDTDLALAWATWLREYAADDGTAGRHAPADRAAEADEVLGKLVSLEPQRPAAWLARYAYRTRYGLAGAEDDLEQARRLAPDDAEVRLASGDWALRTGQPGAEAHFALATDKAPRDRRGYLGLAAAAERSGDRAAAVNACRRGLTHVGQADPWLQLRLAECLVGTPDDARVPAHLAMVERYFKTFEAPAPLSVMRAWRNAVGMVRGRWWLGRQQYAEALACFDRLSGDAPGLAAKAGQPVSVELQYLRAVCFGGLQQWDDAAETFERAWRTQPERADHLLAAGQSWEKARRWKQAARCYERAAEVAPDSTLPRQLLAKLADRQPTVSGAIQP